MDEIDSLRGSHKDLQERILGKMLCKQRPGTGSLDHLAQDFGDLLSVVCSALKVLQNGGLRRESWNEGVRLEKRNGKREISN